MLRRSKLADQCAFHLIGQMDRGHLLGELPGVDRLAESLGVSRETVRAALRLLEEQGRITSRGNGRARQVVTGASKERGKALKVAILLNEPFGEESGSTQVLLLRVRTALENLGHGCFFAAKSQMELGYDLRRIGRLVNAVTADAWLVMAGSGELLHWLGKRPVPVFAIGGRNDIVKIAGVARDCAEVYRQAFRSLIAMGHRRISMICSADRRTGVADTGLAALREELVAAGLPFGAFNAPGWEESQQGLQALLSSLFRVTPPTVLVLAFPYLMTGTLAFLAKRGLRVPNDVSLVCEGMDRTLAWHAPKIAHFHYDAGLAVTGIVGWVETVADGKPNLDRVLLPTQFDPGETIAPPSGKSRLH
ncbi:MAG: substrate-binding domain-containing protein [Verrucomicrobia bacterium]|nr:substrate-binding domain-containing protein [Verrucomicrobiota bacterium]